MAYPIRANSQIPSSTSLPNQLGRGIAYPFQRSATGGVAMAEGESLVRMSVMQILNTTVGERPFQIRNGEMFGTRLKLYLFESVAQITELASYEAKRALDLWEPRIVVDYVLVISASKMGVGDPRFIGVNPHFRYRATNRQDNLVVPVTLAGVNNG